MMVYGLSFVSVKILDTYMPITPRLKIVIPPSIQTDTISEGHPNRRAPKKSLRIIRNTAAIVDTDMIALPR
jgi:hypothetical protein